MNFTTSLHELDRHVGAALRALQTSLEQYEREGINDEALLSTLRQAEEQMRALRSSIEHVLAAHAGTYEMVRYLNRALQIEYQNILDYERYVDTVEDERLAARLKEFGEEERRHAYALSAKIVELGGSPRFSVSHEPRPDMTALDLLREHYQAEQQVIKYYEQGLEQFDDPAFRWMIGKLKLEEEEHLQTLEKLLEEYRDTEILVRESKHFKWIDPYMGQPGDRAWIE